MRKISPMLCFQKWILFQVAWFGLSYCNTVLRHVPALTHCFENTFKTLFREARVKTLTVTLFYIRNYLWHLMLFFKTCFMIHNCNPALVVNGGYTKWSDWGACSTTCNPGVQTKTRTCTNPPPKHGGKECSGLGPARKLRICNKKLDQRCNCEWIVYLWLVYSSYFVTLGYNPCLEHFYVVFRNAFFWFYDTLL